MYVCLCVYLCMCESVAYMSAWVCVCVCVPGVLDPRTSRMIIGPVKPFDRLSEVRDPSPTICTSKLAGIVIVLLIV